MSKNQMKKDYKRLRKRIDEMEKHIDAEVIEKKLSNDEYRLLRAEYFAMCACEGLLRRRIEKL